MTSSLYCFPKKKYENESKSNVELFIEAEKGNFNELKKILSNSFSNKTIEYAIRRCLLKDNTIDENSDYKKCLDLLIDYMGLENINYINTEEGNTTLLMVACSQMNMFMIERLLLLPSISAYIKYEDENKNNALHFLLANGSTNENDKLKALRMLISKNVDFDAPNEEGYCPIAYAVKNGNAKIVQELLLKGACPLQVVKSTGDTLLHLAVINGDENTFDLVNKQKIWKIRNLNGQNAFDLAKEIKSEKFLTILKLECQESKISKTMQALEKFNCGEYRPALELLNSSKSSLKNGTNIKLEWNHLLTYLMLQQDDYMSFKELMQFFDNPKFSNDELDDSLFLYNKSVFYFKLGDLPKTISLLLSYLKRNESPMDSDLYFAPSAMLFEICLFYRDSSLAKQVLAKLEDYTRIKLLESGKKANGSDPVKEYLRANNIANKINIGEEYLALVLLMRTFSQLQEKAVDDAKKTFEEYKKSPVYMDIKRGNLLVETLRQSSKFIKFYLHYSTNQFSKCLKISKDYSEEETSEYKMHYCNSMGILNLRLKKYSISEFLFKKALGHAKEGINHKKANYCILNIIKIKYNLGLAFFFQRQFDKALLLFKSIFQKLQFNPMIYYRIGLCLMQLKIQDHSGSTFLGCSEVVDKIVGYSKNEGNETTLKRIILKYMTITKQSKTSNFINFTEPISYFKDAIILLSDNYYNKKYLQELIQTYTPEGLSSRSGFDLVSQNNLMASLYMNLIFCLNKNQDWSESLFYIREFELLSACTKNCVYFVENYKLEALIALGKIDAAKELVTNAIKVGNINSYPDIDKKGSFFSNSTNRCFKEVSFKIALFVNVAKIQLLKSNLEEARTTISQILGLVSLNDKEGEANDLPGYVINILVYYYLVQENFQAALRVLKTHKVNTTQFDQKKK